jgi:hypothetical protein
MIQGLKEVLYLGGGGAVSEEAAVGSHLRIPKSNRRSPWAAPVEEISHFCSYTYSSSLRKVTCKVKWLKGCSLCGVPLDKNWGLAPGSILAAKHEQSSVSVVVASMSHEWFGLKTTDERQPHDSSRSTAILFRVLGAHF